jgi:hypothetical protein
MAKNSASSKIQILAAEKNPNTKNKAAFAALRAKIMASDDATNQNDKK